MNRRPLLAALSAAAAAPLLLAPALDAQSPAAVTGTSVGAVRLGESYAQLKAAGVVGPIRGGCPLDTGSKSAHLKAPLAGDVELGPAPARRVADISMTGGVSAKGVTVGSRLADIRHAYGTVKVDTATASTFQVDVATVHPSAGGQIEFAIDTKTHKVAVIAVKYIPFCD